MSQYKHQIVIGLFFLVFAFTFYHLYHILLPFVIGLFLALGSQSIIEKIRRVLKSEALSVSVFLVGIVVVIGGFLFLTTQFINRDFQRLNESFTTLAVDNKENIDQAAEKALSYVQELYDFESLNKDLSLEQDSLKSTLENFDYSQIDTESIKEGFTKMMSAFKGDEASEPAPKSKGGFWVMLFSTIMYFVLILYQREYFEGVQKRYFDQSKSSRLNLMWDDFNQSFIRYFRLRSYIVWLLGILYIITFAILDIPGMVLIVLLILILSYIPYLHYIALLPLSLGCLVLSIENDQSFLLLFGIVAGVFVVGSLIEELVLIPMIMEKNIGMNPVIMILAISIWSYVFGWPGLLIGVPLSSLLIIYIKRYFLTSLETVQAKT